MDVEIYIKSLLLLMLEYKEANTKHSIKLIKSLLKYDKKDETTTYNGDVDVKPKLKTLLKTIIDEGTNPDENLLVSIELILADKPELLEIFKKYYNSNNSDKLIENLKQELSKTLKSLRLRRVLHESILNISDPSNIDDAIQYLKDKLEEIKKTDVFKDEAIVGYVDFEDESTVLKASEDAKSLVTGTKLFKTGWSCLNRMCRGGLRRKEFVTILARQHDYKSSLTKSLFAQIVKLNEPNLDDPIKKPLVIFISLEEEIDNITSFLYSYLKYSIEGVEVTEEEIKKIAPKEISEYIIKHMTSKGFHIRIIRARPELFTYSKLFDIIDRMEHENYEIQAVFVDYVKKMNREGCNRNGPQGTDLLDLFSRIRNYMTAKNILFVTPHQMSTEAKQLLRAGIPDLELVKVIANKGYYADSKQLDQEIDLELYLHIAKLGKKEVLTIQRGKHRLPGNTPMEDRYIMLEFPSKKVPIPEESEIFQPCIKQIEEEDEFDL